MILSQNFDNEVCILGLTGEFDAEGVQEHRNQFDALSQSNDFSRLIVDMAQVEFLDSSGIGALVYTYKRLNARGIPMEVQAVGGQPAQLMKLLRMDKAMAITWQGPDHNLAQGALQ